MNAALQAKTMSDQEILRLIRANEREIVEAQTKAHNLCRDNTFLRAELNNRAKKINLYGTSLNGGYKVGQIVAVTSHRRLG